MPVMMGPSHDGCDQLSIKGNSSSVRFMLPSQKGPASPLRGLLIIWIVLASLWPALTATAGQPASFTPTQPETASTRLHVKIPDLNWPAATALLAESGALVIEPNRQLPDAFLATYADSGAARKAAEGLEGHSEVDWVEPDAIAHYAFEPNDPLFDDQIWAQSIDLPAAWNITGGRSDVVVGVVDSGVSVTHPDLTDTLLPGRDLVNDDSVPEDELGHGTAVAGIIAANGNDGVGIAGVAMDVKILPVKVGDADGAAVSVITEGIIWAVDSGADVVNLSLVSESPSNALHEAIRYAYRHDVPVVTAAGNGPESVSYPGAWDETISVGASTVWGALASFSTRANRVDLIAPGANVLVPWWSPEDGNGWRNSSGTSFAAPMVSGTFALLLSINPDLSIEELRSIVLSTALPVERETPVPGAGAGQLDTGASLRALLDRSIDEIWRPVDEPVARGLVNRSWTWGPAPIATGFEAYAQSTRGQRLVRYYDKGRLEVTDPLADRSSPWYVTSGLLVMEMITGQMQVGAGQYASHGAAQVPVAGDIDSPDAPTYADLAAHLDDPPGEAGMPLTLVMSADGTVTNNPEFADYGVTASYLVPETNHQIASVFWDYLNRVGLLLRDDELVLEPLFDPLFYVTGLPITEPYWMSLSIEGEARDVLVQCFERRCLTYTPANPEPWRVEMSNVGRHYYQWRYGREAPLNMSSGQTADAG